MEWVVGFSAGLADGHQLRYGGAEVAQPLPNDAYLPWSFTNYLGDLPHFLALVKVEYHLPVLVPPLLFVGSGGRNHRIQVAGRPANLGPVQICADSR